MPLSSTPAFEQGYQAGRTPHAQEVALLYPYRAVMCDRPLPTVRMLHLGAQGTQVFLGVFMEGR